MKENDMKDLSEGRDPDMPDEVDFSQGVRGKFADRFPSGTKAVVLAPDVAALFPDAKSVNAALRLLADLALKQTHVA